MFFKKLKKQVMVHVEWRRGSSDWESTRPNNSIVGGEAEDRAVAGPSPALGTTILNWQEPKVFTFTLLKSQLVN